MSSHSQTFSQLNPAPHTPSSGWRKLAANGNGNIRSTVAIVALGLAASAGIEAYRTDRNNQIAVSEYLAQQHVPAGQTRTISNIYNLEHTTFEALNPRGGCPTYVLTGEKKVRTQLGCKPE